jgi:predicted pyridoxine 5'-phosphate oxidase superfamily flavin-nucleotide-binding protein
MPDQHRELFGKLPYLLVGSIDEQDRPWASILVGQPGFVSSPDARTLRIDAALGYGDPLRTNLRLGAPVGLLGIELATRRRNRMNGIVVALDDLGFAVQVGQSFGNCPRYIQVRRPEFVAAPASVAAPRPVTTEGPSLAPAAIAQIETADTFFIATAATGARSGDATQGVDVSHRGGKPGFVRVLSDEDGTLLTWPDFNGNLLFNTIGNLLVAPQAGLLFVDFSTGDLLSLTGEATVAWSGSEVAAFAGAERMLQFRVATGLHIASGLPLRWSPPEPAPQLAATGSWRAVDHVLAQAASPGPP